MSAINTTDIRNHVADLNRVIETLTSERDSLVSALSILDNTVTAQPVEVTISAPVVNMPKRSHFSPRRVTATYGEQFNGKVGKGERTAQILSLPMDMPAKEVARITGAHPAYVYTVRRRAA